MLNKEKIELLLTNSGESDFELVFIGQTGSTLMIDYENRKKDIDYIVVCKNLSKQRFKIRHLENDIMHDIFVEEYNFFKDILNHKINLPKVQYWNLYYTFMNVIYQKDLEDNFTYDFNKYKEKYIEVIKTKLKGIGFVKDFGVRFMPSYKSVAMAYVASQFIENENIELTQKIKDGVFSLYQDSHFGLYKAVGKYFGLELDEDNLLIPKGKVFLEPSVHVDFTNIRVE